MSNLTLVPPSESKKCFEEDYLNSYLILPKRLPLLLQKHIDSCMSCQEKILEYSARTGISRKVFGRSFAEQRKLWLGVEIENEGLSFESSTKRKAKEGSEVLAEDRLTVKESRFSKFLLFCRTHQWRILIACNLAIGLPVLESVLEYLYL